MTQKDPWAEFFDRRFDAVNLGRPAVFLIPMRCLYAKDRRHSNKTIEQTLDAFLLDNFDAFTKTKIPSFGIWRNSAGVPESDECVQYEVSFVGKEFIKTLMARVAEIARNTNEQCIYFKAGEDTCLVFPKYPSRPKP